MLRWLVGFLLVPPTAAIIAVVTYHAMWRVGLFPAGAPIDSIDAAASLGAGVAILAVVMTAGAVVGVILLNERGRLSMRWLVVLGAVLGNVPFAFIIVGIVIAGFLRGEHVAELGRYWEGTSGAAVRVLLGIITGVGSALVFWVVTVIGTRTTLQRQ